MSDPVWETALRIVKPYQSVMRIYIRHSIALYFSTYPKPNHDSVSLRNGDPILRIIPWNSWNHKYLEFPESVERVSLVLRAAINDWNV